jgi:DNA modification methylase
VGHGLDYVRTLAWVKERPTPQFTGDRPAVGFEAIVLAHPKGRKKWNGGGKAGVYSHPVVQNCPGSKGVRVHATQKPLGLMLDLVTDFTNPGDLVLDSHMGSGTTGIAALRLGRGFMGCEMQSRPDHPEDSDYITIARDALGAELVHSDRAAVQRGQVPLFG